jgi:hypothetical protein
MRHSVLPKVPKCTFVSYVLHRLHQKKEEVPKFEYPSVLLHNQMYYIGIWLFIVGEKYFTVDSNHLKRKI